MGAVRVSDFGALVIVGITSALAPAAAGAQVALSLSDAITRALAAQPVLKAAAERIAAARGLREQAGTLPNPDFVFQNENLRPGQSYARDVDTMTYVTQPLELFGTRAARLAVADDDVARAEADYQTARLETARQVSLIYWAARGAQDSRDLLRSTAETFARIVDYHTAQLSVGAIAEQDVLRVQLEGERLAIAANVAALNAQRARIQLLKAMGAPADENVTLADALDAGAIDVRIAPVADVVANHPAVAAARAALIEAQARARLQAVAARPTIGAIAGYKRTLLPDHADGMNTAVAGVTMTLPLFDRNEGNRAAADAEVRRAQDLLDAAQAGVRADYEDARQNYELRRTTFAALLAPLREHAATIASIAQAAYTRAGTDLLRLLDAQRAQLDADAAWVQGMVEFRQSIVNLEAAEGLER